MENNIRVLFCCPSPRANIVEVQKWQYKLPVDKFIPYFMWEPDAYHVAREFFLEHTEYTHLAIATDDIVLKPEHIQAIKRDLEEKDYPVICGMMNINEDGFGADMMNITTNVPSYRWYNRQYDWIYTKDIPKYTGKWGPIIPVGYNGFALMVLRRDIVKRFAFESDALYENIPAKKGGALDVHVCWNCSKNGISVMTDTRIEMRHLRKSGKMRVDVMKPFALYWRMNGKRIFYDVIY
jgi:hypothetical protein